MLVAHFDVDSVGTWAEVVAAVGTVSAFFATAWALRVERRDRREDVARLNQDLNRRTRAAEAEARRAAGLVRVDVAEPGVIVHNDSRDPIFGLRVVHAHAGEANAAEYYVWMTGGAGHPPPDGVTLKRSESILRPDDHAEVALNIGEIDSVDVVWNDGDNEWSYAAVSIFPATLTLNRTIRTNPD